MKSILLLLVSTLAAVAWGSQKNAFLQVLGGCFNKLVEARSERGEQDKIIRFNDLGELKALNVALSAVPYLHSESVKGELDGTHFGPRQWSQLLTGLVKVREEKRDGDQVICSLSENELIAITTMISLLSGAYKQITEEHMEGLINTANADLPTWLTVASEKWLLDKNQVLKCLGQKVSEDDMEVDDDVYMQDQSTLKRQDLVEAVNEDIKDVPSHLYEFIGYLGDSLKRLLELRNLGGAQTFLGKAKHFEALQMALSAIPHLYNGQYAAELAKRYFDLKQWSLWMRALGKLVAREKYQGRDDLFAAVLEMEEMGAINNLLSIYFNYFKSISELDIQRMRTNIKMPMEELLRTLGRNWGLDADVIAKITLVETDPSSSGLREELMREGYLDVMMEDQLAVPDYPQIDDAQFKEAWTQQVELPAPMLKETVTQPSTNGPVITYEGVQTMAKVYQTDPQSLYQALMSQWKSIVRGTVELRVKFEPAISAGGIKKIKLQPREVDILTMLILMLPSEEAALRLTFTGAQLTDIAVRMLYMLQSIKVKDGKSLILPVSHLQALALSSYVRVMEAALKTGRIEQHIADVIASKNDMNGWAVKVAAGFGLSPKLRRQEMKKIAREHCAGKLRSSGRESKMERRLAVAQKYTLALTQTLSDWINKIMQMGARKEMEVAPDTSLFFFVDLMRILPTMLGDEVDVGKILPLAAFVQQVQPLAIRSTKRFGKVATSVMMPMETMRAVKGTLKIILKALSRSDPLEVYALVRARTTTLILNVVNVTIVSGGQGGVINAEPEKIQQAVSALTNADTAGTVIKQITKEEEQSSTPVLELDPALKTVAIEQAEILVGSSSTMTTPVAEKTMDGLLTAVEQTQKVDETQSIEMVSNLTERFKNISNDEVEEKSNELVRLTNEAVKELTKSVGNQVELERARKLDLKVTGTTTAEGEESGEKVEQLNKALSTLEILADKEPTTEAIVTEFTPVLNELAETIVTEGTTVGIAQVKETLGNKLASILAKVDNRSPGSADWSVLEADELQILRGLIKSETVENGISQIDLAIARRLVEAHDQVLLHERMSKEPTVSIIKTPEITANALVNIVNFALECKSKDACMVSSCKGQCTSFSSSPNIDYPIIDRQQTDRLFEERNFLASVESIAAA